MRTSYEQNALALVNAIYVNGNLRGDYVNIKHEKERCEEVIRTSNRGTSISSENQDQSSEDALEKKRVGNDIPTRKRRDNKNDSSSKDRKYHDNHDSKAGAESESNSTRCLPKRVRESRVSITAAKTRLLRALTIKNKRESHTTIALSRQRG